MTCCIEVTAYRRGSTPTDIAKSHTVQARLLTDELRVLIERQNIDCSDINSMKWPLIGLSRHATCKLLLTKTDLWELTQVEDRVPSDEFDFGYGSEYRIWFRSSEQTDQVTYFNRMFVAEIQPLMASAFGNPKWGEALFVVTFKCIRWARRSLHFLFPNESNAYQDVASVSEMNWLRNGYAASGLGTEYRIEHLLKFAFGESPSYPQGELTAPFLMPWQKTITEPFEAMKKVLAEIPGHDSLEGAEILSGGGGIIGGTPRIPVNAGRLDHAPYQKIIDKAVFDAGDVLFFTPFGSPSAPGQYRWKVKYFGSWSADFVVNNRTRIIAGALIGRRFQFALDDETLKFLAPPIVSEMVRGYARVRSRTSYVPNGDLPNVFFDDATDKVEYVSSKTLSSGKIRTPGPRPANPYNGYRAHFTDFDAEGGGIEWAPRVFIESDFDSRMGFDATRFVADHKTDHGAAEGHHRDLETRYEYATDYTGCDLWFSGWLMPTSDELAPYMAWLELRLQTDDKGFGFPTTRIWSDQNDPLLSPQVGDGETGIKGLGMVKTWKGYDGDTRVCVDFPFGIPCLVEVVANTRIEPGVDRWRYTVRRAYKITSHEEPQTPLAHTDGLGSGATGDFVGYNLAENRNTATFSAPGYKLPLAQSGFSVLPVGEDRDGVLHPVIVQGMIYSSQYDKQRCVYFCVPNAIDGDCA